MKNGCWFGWKWAWELRVKYYITHTLDLVSHEWYIDSCSEWVFIMIYVALNSFTHDCSVLVKAYVSRISFLTCSHSHRPTNLSLSLFLRKIKTPGPWNLYRYVLSTLFLSQSFLYFHWQQRQSSLTSLQSFSLLGSAKCKPCSLFDNRIAIPC